MPELPEVQTIVTGLRPRLLGRPISDVRLLRRDIFHPPDLELPTLLAGRRIADVSRRGKKIIITLDNAQRFYIHLGMTGRLTLEASETPLLPHTHLILSLQPNQELRFRDPRRFGGIWWISGDCQADTNLGPEALDLKPADLSARLSKTRRAIKSALLDQSLIAGLGNIYADEALFAAGIHPTKRADRITRDQAAVLTRAIKQVLKRAIRHNGSTLRDYRDADGNSGDFQRLHRVYDRKGRPCHNCRTPIQRIVLTGRSTHFCPACQPRSAARR